MVYFFIPTIVQKLQAASQDAIENILISVFLWTKVLFVQLT